MTIVWTDGQLFACTYSPRHPDLALEGVARTVTIKHLTDTLSSRDIRSKPWHSTGSRYHSPVANVVKVDVRETEQYSEMPLNEPFFPKATVDFSKDLLEKVVICWITAQKPRERLYSIFL